MTGVNPWRKDFPILEQAVHGKPLAYLDNGATAQKPAQVIDAISHYYHHDNANVHRGVHALSERATLAFEQTRKTIAKAINAPSQAEVIYSKGTTDAINLVASSLSAIKLKAGDEIIIGSHEHHSNIVPWQLAAERHGCTIKVIPMLESLELDMDALKKLLNEKTKIVAVAHVSNVLGIINPVKDICALAREVGACTVIDGAQALPHLEIDVQDLGCDFYAFSGHKMFAPTGIGVLYGRRELLEPMPPYQGGGEMIATVSYTKSTYAELPCKFEAGTPNIAGVVGLDAAFAYLNQLDRPAAEKHEQDLLDYASTALAGVKGLRQFAADAKHRVPVVSFLIDGIHAHDLGTIVDRQGVAVRVGHHCAMPLMDQLGVGATARASMAFYNTKAEIDQLIEALEEAKALFGI